MQQRNKLLKYILDIEAIIQELEDILNHHNNDYKDFQTSFISVRAVERDLTIIGEAIGKIMQLDSNINISGTKHIIGLRNLIVHAYDSIDPSVIWRILIKDIPLLKKEIKELKK